MMCMWHVRSLDGQGKRVQLEHDMDIYQWDVSALSNIILTFLATALNTHVCISGIFRLLLNIAVLIICIASVQWNI